MGMKEIDDGKAGFYLDLEEQEFNGQNTRECSRLMKFSKVTGDPKKGASKH